MDTHDSGYGLPATGRPRDFHPLECAHAGRTENEDGYTTICCVSVLVICTINVRIVSGYADFLTEINECRKESRKQCQADKEHESPEIIASRTDDNTYDNRDNSATGIAKHIHDTADSPAVLPVCTHIGFFAI